jgi:hypothetical protein
MIDQFLCIQRYVRTLVLRYNWCQGIAISGKLYI